MRTNIYSQELTNEVKLVEKTGPDGEKFSAVQLMLHSSPMLHQPPDHVGNDDDRSAVAIWLPKSAERRETLAQTFEEMAKLVRKASPESTSSSSSLTNADHEIIFDKELRSATEKERLIDTIGSLEPSNVSHEALLRYGFRTHAMFNSNRAWVIDRLEAQPLQFIRDLLAALYLDEVTDAWFERQKGKAEMSNGG